MSEPTKPARVSKAPPPIEPLRGGGYVPPPNRQPARWEVWRFIPSAALWQAVCLSLNTEPDEHLKTDATRPQGNHSRLPAEYGDRLKVCQANTSTQGPIHPKGTLNRGMLTSPHCPVALSEIAAFATECGWTIPDEMRALAPPPSGAPLVAPAPSPAVSNKPDRPPAWIALAQTKALEIIKRQKVNDLYPSQIAIADEIAATFRDEAPQVVGVSGKPLTGETIKRHALKGIDSAQGRQLSTAIGRGKQGKK